MDGGERGLRGEARPGLGTLAAMSPLGAAHASVSARLLASALLVATVGCSRDEPRDLGDNPRDAVVIDESPVLEHLGQAYEGGGDRTIGSLLADPDPVFNTPPNPRALLDRQLAEHASLLPIDDGANLRVLTFNLGLLDRWYPFTTADVPEVDLRREHVPPRVFSGGWDVLCFQEVFETIDVDRIRLAAEDRGYRIYEGTSKNHGKHGLVIAVREALIDDEGQEYKHEQIYEQQYDTEHFPGPGVARGFLSWSFVHAPTGQRVTVLDTHTSSFAARWRVRAFQARELGLYVRSRVAKEIVVLGGDFNAAPYYPEDVFGVDDGEAVGEWFANTIMYPVLLHYAGGWMIDAMAASGVADDIDAIDGLPAYDEAAWDREPYGDRSLCDAEKFTLSWDWCNPLGFDNYGGASEYAARIDYIFVRDLGDDVRVLDAGLHYTEPETLGDVDIELSDHYAVGATLRLRNAR